MNKSVRVVLTATHEITVPLGVFSGEFQLGDDLLFYFDNKDFYDSITVDMKASHGMTVLDQKIKSAYVVESK